MSDDRFGSEARFEYNSNVVFETSIGEAGQQETALGSSFLSVYDHSSSGENTAIMGALLASAPDTNERADAIGVVWESPVAQQPEISVTTENYVPDAPLEQPVQTEVTSPCEPESSIDNFHGIVEQPQLAKYLHNLFISEPETSFKDASSSQTVEPTQQQNQAENITKTDGSCEASSK